MMPFMGRSDTEVRPSVQRERGREVPRPALFPKKDAQLVQSNEPLTQVSVTAHRRRCLFGFFDVINRDLMRRLGGRYT